MIGTKKLSEIKRDLRQAFRNQDEELNAWLDRKIAKHRPKTARVPRVVEDLLWIRELLREAVAETKPDKKRVSATSRKRTLA